MRRRTLFTLLGLLLIVGLCAGLFAYVFIDVREIKEYHKPAVKPEEVLVDDRLEDKATIAFDPGLVHRQPIAEWNINLSSAVIKLDVPELKPDEHNQYLQELHPSYAAAIFGRSDILWSVNMVDGKAKQFDDGLYAALDLAYYRGVEGKLRSHVDLVKALFDKVDKKSPAAPFLAAGLELAGVKVEVADIAAKEKYLRDFRANEVRSKPIGFYTWNEKLGECFRFMRFFMREFDETNLTIPAELLATLREGTTASDYGKAVAFYRKLSNPSICLSVAEFDSRAGQDRTQWDLLFKKYKVFHRTVALFPPSTSRETVLFEKLFPFGLPEGADLMRELVKRIRSGEVDLKPQPNSGWYDYQVYALETLLLPEKGPEKDKLLLTANYKKRMLEAFKALLAKRRETHFRLSGGPKSATYPAELINVQPRLRVEPCPSYYLRTARAYAFLANFLDASVGSDALSKMKGLTKDGERKLNLHEELAFMRELFYGLHLVSAEDIGMKPALLPDEPVDQEKCYQAAMNWLGRLSDDADLAADTRVSIPVYADPQQKRTRLWATLGVRLARLDASFVRPPRVKPANGTGDWKEVESWKLRTARYLLPVDEFAEFELQVVKTLTREELRQVCDEHKSKAAILTALGGGTGSAQSSAGFSWPAIWIGAGLAAAIVVLLAIWYKLRRRQPR